MPSYDPQPFVRVNGVTWTGNTVANIQITQGRPNINQQQRAGYANISIVTADDETYPDFDIEDLVEVGVLDTLLNEKLLFTGRISDNARILLRKGETGYLTENKITAVGILSRVNRQLVGASGYAQELDGIRVENIIGEAVGLTYPAYGDYYGYDTSNIFRTNLVLNPSIEVNVDGWQRNNSNIALPTQVTTDSFTGTASMAFTSNVTANAASNTIRTTNTATYRVACAPGDTFTYSVYVKNTVGTRSLSIGLDWFTSATTTTAISRTSSATVTNPTTWTRISVTGTAPATTTHMGIIVRFNSNGAIGDTALLDGFLVETGSTLNTYYDGSSTGVAVQWNGTPNNSTSTLRVNGTGTYALAGTQTWATLDPYLDIFDNGSYDIRTYSAGATNAYSLASTVANSGRGVIYETADGRVGYRDSQSRVDETNFIDIPGEVILADGLQTNTRIADVANSIQVKYATASTVSDINQASIDAYGKLNATVETLLADISSANALLDYYLNTRSLPRKSLERMTVALHLDNMSNTLREELLDVYLGTAIQTTDLPASIYPTRFNGFVEGWVWVITRNTMFLTLIVSEYNMSVVAESWSQVNAAEAWNTISATLEWQEARVVT